MTRRRRRRDQGSSGSRSILVAAGGSILYLFNTATSTHHYCCCMAFVILGSAAMVARPIQGRGGSGGRFSWNIIGNYSRLPPAATSSTSTTTRFRIVANKALMPFLLRGGAQEQESQHQSSSLSNTKGIIVNGRHDSNRSSRSINNNNNDNNPNVTIKLLQVQIIHRHGDRTPITPMMDEEFWRSTLPTKQVLDQIAMGTKVKGQSSTATSSTSTPTITSIGQGQGRKEAAGGSIEGTGEGPLIKKQHGAAGRGPFGQLTTLGILQMISLGNKLREELVHDEEQLQLHHADPDQVVSQQSTPNNNQEQGVIGGDGNEPSCAKLFHSITMPLTSRRVKVRSTDFTRTIQSVHALLVGLFPNGINAAAPMNNNGIRNDKNDDDDGSKVEGLVEIDVSQTNNYIPDPLPRHTKEQEKLESDLGQRLYIIQKDNDMRQVAIRVMNALYSSKILAADAAEISHGFNAGGDNPSTSNKMENEHSPDQERKPTTSLLLPWAQLSEICKCLRLRNKLPPEITSIDQEAITAHAAWRWFEIMKHAKLSKLAMHRMMSDILDNIEEGRTMCPLYAASLLSKMSSSKDMTNVDDVPLLYIYSGHDSTLIGLLCAFQLEQPAVWPEYASYLKIELLSVSTSPLPQQGQHDNQDKNNAINQTGNMCAARHYVRFSLNGSPLRCHLGNNNIGGSSSSEMIPVEVLHDFIRTESSVLA